MDSLEAAAENPAWFSATSTLKGSQKPAKSLLSEKTNCNITGLRINAVIQQ